MSQVGGVAVADFERSPFGGTQASADSPLVADRSALGSNLQACLMSPGSPLSPTVIWSCRRVQDNYDVSGLHAVGTDLGFD